MSTPDATECHETLHRLSVRQERAIGVLLAGGSHEQAAESARVHRVTVTRWVNHHPAVIAAMNNSRLESQARHQFITSQLMEKAMSVIEAALDEGDRSVAIRWLSMTTHHHRMDVGPIESSAVVEEARTAMPTFVEEVLATGERTAADAERLIRLRVVDPE